MIGGPDTIQNLHGYAQIPTGGHPWSDLEDYDDLNIGVNGGLTFGPRPEIVTAWGVYKRLTLADTKGWIGFDTNHAWDVWSPEVAEELGLDRTHAPYLVSGPWDRWWTLDKVIEEAKSLARSIAEAAQLDQELRETLKNL
jgi:hypothetical protein